MKTSFSSWIATYAPNIQKCIASSKRLRSHPYEKEVIQLLQNGSYKYSRFSKKQDYTTLHQQSERESLLLHFSQVWKQLDILLLDNIRHHIRFLDENGTNISYSISSNDQKVISLLHNREKVKPFIDGVPFPPFISLQLQNKDGKVEKLMKSKFNQINSFLLLMKPSVDLWMQEKKNGERLHFFDMGCGKGYITHALAHYFSNLYPNRIRVTGIDSRLDVIEMAKKAIPKESEHFLSFSHSSIGKGSYTDLISEGESIAIIALHACDTATDVALLQANAMKAELFFIAPCCHQEISLLLPKLALPFVQTHPILHQRYASLVTDGMRAALMESVGWKVDAIEFIDPEHTPKNTLLKGIFTGIKKEMPIELRELIQIMKKEPLLYKNSKS